MAEVSVVEDKFISAKKVLKKYYGYNSFRKHQVEVIKNILAKKDTFALMPTGSGKSICYQIPALVFPGITLVISPLISLMKDQVDTLKEKGITATYLNSSLSQIEYQNRLEKLKEAKYKLVYLAPERLKVNQFCQFIAKLKIQFVAIDEAHCVSEWGHDFRPSYLYISNFIEKYLDNPIIAAFTATATPFVRDDIINILRLTDPFIYLGGLDRPNLKLKVKKTINKEKYILNYLQEKENSNNSGIIYVSTRKKADILDEFLKAKGYQTGSYHAGLSAKKRIEIQDEFLADKLKIIIATNAFGMGIDKGNVRYVIHYNMPKDLESYYQEAGRAGRDGKKSECILLFSMKDYELHKYMIEKKEIGKEIKKRQIIKLKAILKYCHTLKCLRSFILDYFGAKEKKEFCANCTNCLCNSRLLNITPEAKMIFSCIYKLKEKEDIITIAQVLSASNNQKIETKNYDKVSTYGLMEDYSLAEIWDIIKYLKKEKYIKSNEKETPILKLSNKAWMVLKNRRKIKRRVYHKKCIIRIISRYIKSFYELIISRF